MDDVFLETLFSRPDHHQSRAGKRRRVETSLEESFTDRDLSLSSNELPAPPPPTEIVEWKYIMLPEDRKEVEKRVTEDEQESISSPEYVCELCRMGDMAKESMGTISSMLQRVYEVEDRSYRRVPNQTRYESVARKYNETIWQKNERLGKKKIPLRKWTAAMVRHHFTVCERSRPERQIGEDVQILDQNITFIRYHGLYRQKIVNGEEKEIELDKSNHERLLKAMLTKASLLKTIDSFSGTSQRKRRGMDAQQTLSAFVPSNTKKDSF